MGNAGVFGGEAGAECVFGDADRDSKLHDGGGIFAPVPLDDVLEV